MSDVLHEIYVKLNNFQQQLDSAGLADDLRQDINTTLHNLLATCEQGTNPDVMDELKKLLEDIQQSRKQFGTITSQHGDILEANDELDAVLATTEEAANNIMDATEEIMNLGEALGSQQEKIMDLCTSIFEACNFQDLTGQRIRNVIKTLGHVEQSITALLNGETPPERPLKTSDELTDEDLMNGPAKLGEEPTQDDIDKLFSDS